MMITQSPIDKSRHNIILLTVIGTIVSCLLVAISGIFPLYNITQEMQGKELVFAQKTKALLIEHHLNHLKEIAVQITSRTKARKLLIAYNRNIINYSQLTRELTPILLDPIRHNELILGITRLNAKGEVAVATGLAIPLEYWLDYNEVKTNAKLTGPVRINNQQYLIVLAPIMGLDTHKVGTDIVLFSMQVLKKIIISPMELGNTAKIIVGHTIKNTIVSLLPLPKIWLQQQNEIESLLLKPISGDSGIVERKNNKNYSMAFGPIPGSDWGMIAIINNNELLASVEEIKQFAYIVSHDLRAPLVNIKGFSSELVHSVEELKNIVSPFF